MITHVVFFWVPEGDQEKVKKLLEGAKILADVPGVQNYRFGQPVPSPRSVVDGSYAVALCMDFADQAAADIYQDHPIHERFVQEYVKPLTTKVVVYDFS